MRTRVQRLSTQVVIMMVTILVVTLAAGFAVVQHNLRRLIGEVSVGFLTAATVAGEMASTLAGLASYFLAVLALGVLAAFGLSRRLKRQTFGLELGEIAALLQEREAMLHGIREGVLGYDKNERIVLANDFARQLLDLLPEFVGRPLRHVLPPGRLADVVTGDIEGSDLLVLRGD